MFFFRDQFVLSQLGCLQLAQQSYDISSALVPGRSVPSFRSPVFQLQPDLRFQVFLLTLKLQTTSHEVLEFVIWYGRGPGERHLQKKPFTKSNVLAERNLCNRNEIYHPNIRKSI
jgi:hypothetical protein